MDKLSFATLAIIVAVVGAITSVFVFAVDMKQSQKEGFERIDNRLTLYFAEDEALNDSWLKSDENDHGDMLDALKDMKVEMTAQKSEIDELHNDIEYIAKDRLEELETLFQTVLGEIADVRVAVAECK